MGRFNHNSKTPFQERTHWHRYYRGNNPHITSVSDTVYNIVLPAISSVEQNLALHSAFHFSTGGQSSAVHVRLLESADLSVLMLFEVGRCLKCKQPFPFALFYFHALSESMYACASVCVFECYICTESIFKKTFTEADVH